VPLITAAAADRGDRTSPRGRPSAYTPDVAQRVRELVGQGWSMTSICHAIGIDLAPDDDLSLCHSRFRILQHSKT
jgi:hypothetical protein